MAEPSERIITDDTAREILEAIRNIPGVYGAVSVDHGGTGATTAEEALRNLGAQPLIDADVKKELGEMVKSVNSIKPDDNGNIEIVHVRTAENLTTDDAQDIYGAFIERTTGGNAPVADGKSWLGVMKGNSVRVGYTKERKGIQAINKPREPITATMDWSIFRTIYNESVRLTIVYDGTIWKLSNDSSASNVDMASYVGVTVTGYPIAGDSIIITYTPKAESMNSVTDSGTVVTINWTTYEAKYETSPVTFFTYASGSWSDDPSEYGISVSGTPADGDVITISYTPEQHNIYVNPVIRGDALVGYVDWDAFKTAVNFDTAEIAFNYSTSWDQDMSNYGVTFSGSPIKGDQILVYFVKEDRGHIVNSTPEKIVSTGWNLYNHETGRARVLKYSNTYGFVIGGTYTSATFAATLDGERTSLSIDSDGNFAIPSDGYVFVTGGDDETTFIYMTFSDWAEGYSGEFVSYSESDIDISSLMQTNFPYGLCSVGAISDEIDFSNKVATNRIERINYTVADHELIKLSGKDFTYDEDYIYVVRDTPISVGFSLSNEMDAYDHGMEFVEGTTVPVFIHMLYGQNLRDKLRTNVVTLSSQSLTDLQKQQVRENLGLGGYEALPIENGGTGAANVSSARTNLGLGTAAVKNVASVISSTEIGLPTAAVVNSAIEALSGVVAQKIKMMTASTFDGFADGIPGNDDTSRIAIGTIGTSQDAPNTTTSRWVCVCWMDADGTNGVQLAISFASTSLHIRNKSSNTWSGWRTV